MRHPVHRCHTISDVNVGGLFLHHSGHERVSCLIVHNNQINKREVQGRVALQQQSTKANYRHNPSIQSLLQGTHTHIQRRDMKDIESNKAHEDGKPLMTQTDKDVLEMEPGPDDKGSLQDQDQQQQQQKSSGLSSLGLKILVLLAFQNCFKNLLMRYVMKEKPDFLTSAAVIGVEVVKLVLCVLWIVLVDKRPLSSIYEFLRDDHRNSVLLGIPAAAYSFQMSMEYIALANLDAAVFSVLVQCKLLTTATFSAVLLRKKLKYIQIISLILLTAGVMLINVNKLKTNSNNNTTDSAAEEAERANMTTGVIATLGKTTKQEKQLRAQGQVTHLFCSLFAWRFFLIGWVDRHCG